MSIQRAEQLKRDWTDQFVVVQKGVPELRRFDGFVGQVKTVNMNCRLLIQFDTPADISWYDIDPQFVSVVDLPERNPAAEAETKPLPSPTSARPAVIAAVAAAVTPPNSSASPLDIIRRQSAAKNSGAKVVGSPLDQIRAQAAGGAQGTADAKEPGDQAQKRKTSAASPAVNAPAGGSPLDQIRAQAARVQSTTQLAPAAPEAPVQLPVDSAAVSSVTSDAADAESGAATAAPFRVGTASSPTSGSDQLHPEAVSAARKETPGTHRASDIRIPALIDQIRAQASDDGETPGIPSSLFEQIRRQAAES